MPGRACAGRERAWPAAEQVVQQAIQEAALQQLHTFCRVPVHAPILSICSTGAPTPATRCTHLELHKARHGTQPRPALVLRRAQRVVNLAQHLQVCVQTWGVGRHVQGVQACSSACTLEVGPSLTIRNQPSPPRHQPPLPAPPPPDSPENQGFLRSSSAKMQPAGGWGQKGAEGGSTAVHWHAGRLRCTVPAVPSLQQIVQAGRRSQYTMLPHTCCPDVHPWAIAGGAVEQLRRPVPARKHLPKRSVGQ